MKRHILLAGCLSLLVIGIISVSCSKDDDKKEWKGCSCRVIWDDGDEERESLSPSEVKEQGADSCDRLVTILKRDADPHVSNIYCVDL
jgi:hypothetical protein